MPRKYEKVQELIPIIKQKIENGFSYRQIAEEYGLDKEKVIRNLMYRERHNVYPGISKTRGRKPAKTLIMSFLFCLHKLVQFNYSSCLFIFTPIPASFFSKRSYPRSICSML